MTEPKLVTKGTGWSAYRLGRSICLQIDRPAGEDYAEVWIPSKASDMARSSLLAALVGGRYGAVQERAAMEALQANW